MRMVAYQSFIEISKSMLQQFDNLEGANTLKAAISIKKEPHQRLFFKTF